MELSEIIEKELWGKKVKIKPWQYCKCQICTQRFGFIDSIERPSLWKRNHGTQEDIIYVRSSSEPNGEIQGFLTDRVELL